MPSTKSRDQILRLSHSGSISTGETTGDPGSAVSALAEPIHVYFVNRLGTDDVWRVTDQRDRSVFHEFVGGKTVWKSLDQDVRFSQVAAK